MTACVSGHQKIVQQMVGPDIASHPAYAEDRPDELEGQHDRSQQMPDGLCQETSQNGISYLKARLGSSGDI